MPISRARPAAIHWLSTSTKKLFMPGLVKLRVLLRVFGGDPVGV
jgi:hypothetical protein